MIEEQQLTVDELKLLGKVLKDEKMGIMEVALVDKDTVGNILVEITDSVESKMILISKYGVVRYL